MSWNRVGNPIQSLQKTTGHNFSSSMTIHHGSKKHGNDTPLGGYFDYQKNITLNNSIMLQHIFTGASID